MRTSTLSGPLMGCPNVPSTGSSAASPDPQASAPSAEPRSGMRLTCRRSRSGSLGDRVVSGALRVVAGVALLAIGGVLMMAHLLGLLGRIVKPPGSKQLPIRIVKPFPTRDDP